MVRTLLCTNDAVLHAGFKSILEQPSELEFAGAVSHWHEISARVSADQIDVVLIDMHPGLTVGVIAQLRRSLPSLPVVLWVHSIEIEVAHQAVHMGVHGILRKDLPVELLQRCLLKVAEGELWYDRGLSDLLLRSKEIKLSPRERQLLRLISQGFANKQIAGTLMITEGTVKVYLSKLFKKVGVTDRFELALYGLRHMQYGPTQTADGVEHYCPASFIVEERAGR